MFKKLVQNSTFPLRCLCGTIVGIPDLSPVLSVRWTVPLGAAQSAAILACARADLEYLPFTCVQSETVP